MGGGRRILLAGATSGMGEAVARQLSRSDGRLFFFDRCSEKASRLASEIGAQTFQGQALDARDREQLAAEIRNSFGGLDAVVVMVGALHVARLSETTDDAWDGVLGSNLIAPFLIAQTCLPLVDTDGAIVFLGSGTAQRPDVELGAYSVAKRSLERMAQVLAMEAALRGIRVNVVNPGETESPSSSISAPHLREIPATPVPPLGRRAKPEDVACAIDFFVSEASSFCTGASLTVDGGLRAALRSHRVRQ